MYFPMNVGDNKIRDKDCKVLVNMKKYEKKKD